jgi:hypothetical protein
MYTAGFLCTPQPKLELGNDDARRSVEEANQIFSTVV